MLPSESQLRTLTQRQLSYTPVQQDYYTFYNDRWTSSTIHAISPDETSSHISQLALITWNIDFVAPQPRPRMATALAHLWTVVEQIPEKTAVVIFLQEMLDDEHSDRSNESHRDNHKDDNGEETANDLSQIANAPWVRNLFHVTDMATRHWSTAYGQVTLVDRRLNIASVSRLRLVSEFMREALIVDVRLAGADDAAPAPLLRLCNVHLDSFNGPLRPVQWAGLAAHLQDSTHGVQASILAGDCNATRSWDATAPMVHGFRDAAVELGIGDNEQSATWGFQSLRWERYGRSRLDKEVFWGDIEVQELRKIGVGVKVEGEEGLRLREGGYLDYATDHHGLLGVFKVGTVLSTAETYD